MRCLALAQAWQDGGGDAVFVTSTGNPRIESRLHDEDIQVELLSSEAGSDDDARETVAVARRSDAARVVVDGYRFGGDFQQSVKDAGLRLLVLHDYGHAKHYWADLVLNQNLHADGSLYSAREPHTRLVLGPRYALLRREFAQWRDWKRTIPEVACKILVTLGGGDPDNVTLNIIEALDRVEVDGLQAIVVVGANNPHYQQLQAAAERSSASIRLQSNVGNMPELMAWADVAVTGGGSTNWELAFMGLPSLIVVLADNQQSVARRLADAGAAIDLGWHESLDAGKLVEQLRDVIHMPARRREMSDRGRDVVDGEGAGRVLLRLSGNRARIRKARQDDCELLWTWANEPGVRAMSFSTEPIPWNEHVAWFTSRLGEPACLIYLGLDENDVPIGQVRFDVEQNEAKISVSIAREHRGQGYGSLLIDLGAAEVFRRTDCLKIHAFIKPNNDGSITAFERSGFRSTATARVRDCEALHYVRDRTQ